MTGLTDVGHTASKITGLICYNTSEILRSLYNTRDEYSRNEFVFQRQHN